VVVLCGPPGAGKTTAARASGLTVYDRDDAKWGNETQFRAAIGALAGSSLARAVVIRAGASSSARAKAVALVGATHVYMLTADQKELAHRVARRNRADKQKGLASIRTWFEQHDAVDGVEPFPGWDLVWATPAGNVAALAGVVSTAPGVRSRRWGSH
jgi:shikimate kinase